MTPELKEQILQASKGLKIKDIFLYESAFTRPVSDPRKLTQDAIQEHMRGVRFFTAENESEASEPKFLQVLVTLGTRVVPESEPEKEDREVIFKIEASFLVNYEMQAEIDKDCIKAFADNNAVHNVWPFWRQHVFDILSRARLPQLEIPLYSGFKM